MSERQTDPVHALGAVLAQIEDLTYDQRLDVLVAALEAVRDGRRAFIAAGPSDTGMRRLIGAVRAAGEWAEPLTPFTFATSMHPGPLSALATELRVRVPTISQAPDPGQKATTP